jgi:hypothetical protein
MAKQRERRFASASELARALDAWISSAERSTLPARRFPSASRMRIAGAFAVAAAAVAAFLLFEDGSGSTAARGHAATTERSAVRSPARSTTLLLGDASRAFDRRLADWMPLVGGGTFGTDDDGPGVVGLSGEGLTAVPYALPDGRGRVRGRVEPLAPQPGVRTRAAGAGIEFSDGSIVALLLVSAEHGYDVRVCELLRENATEPLGENATEPVGEDAIRLVRGPELETHAVVADEGRPLAFELEWTDTGAHFDWSDGAAAIEARGSGSSRIPTRARADARPIRFWLVVESGSARFDELVLEGT